MAEPSSSVSTIPRHLGWNTLRQAAPLVSALLLTPFLLSRLGVDRYGLFALAQASLTVLTQLDGGIGNSAQRFFAVYSGSGDAGRTTRLFTSALTSLIAGGVVIGAVMAASARPIVSLLAPPDALTSDAVFLVYALPVLVALELIRNLLQGLLHANGRWRTTAAVSVVTQALNFVLTLVLVRQGLGVRGVVLALGAQAVGALLLLFASSVSYLWSEELGFLPLADLRGFVGYAAKHQVVAASAMINLEVDALLIAAILPIRYVAFYSIGAGVATQVRTLPLNALGPLATSLGVTFGRSGRAAAVVEFAHLQRLWLRTALPYSLVSAATVYYAITAWLGPGQRLAGLAATVLMLGHAVDLSVGVIDTLTNTLGRPGMQARSSAMSVVVNLVLTIPMAMAFGLLGVVAATSLSLLVGAAYFLHMARAALGDDVRRPFAGFPLGATALGMAVAVALEVLVQGRAQTGLPGLVVAGVPALVGLGLTGAVLVGSERRHSSRAPKSDAAVRG